MDGLIAKSNVSVVIGMGMTGRSVARFFSATGQPFVWLDTRTSPPNIESLRQEFPSVSMELGDINPETLLAASEIVVSPGVPLSTPALQQAKGDGVKIIGDIDLFLRHAEAPVVAITGSNAKSTVTTLVGEMANAAGKRAAVGGNIGVAVLDLLDDAVDCYILELSSFQLETVEKLSAKVACVLNVSEDHMDRYDSLPHYHRAKQRIYFGAETVVYNRDDVLTAPPMANSVNYYTFGLSQPDRNGFGTLLSDGEVFLAHEFKPLIAVSRVKLSGKHNISNVLAALAIGYALGLPVASMLEVIEEFPGLPHRCQWVACADDVNWYNDSKATNVGAAQAAIDGLHTPPGKIVLLAGGVGKGADFSPLKKQAGALRAVVTIGEDGPAIAEVFKDSVDCHSADSLQQAVSLCKRIASAGDTVLLSPACASFDMFSGYEDRGRQFEACVKEALA